MTSASVKFIRSSDKGVPPAPSDWATFVAWIKGVFINGFNEVNVTRVAHQTGELTLTLPDNHGFEQWQVLSLSGAADARFNVDMRVLRVRGQDVTCSVDNRLPPTTTGTMKVKQAPVGWEITYENETVLVLHSKAPGGQYYFQFLKRDDRAIEIRGAEGWFNGQPVNEWYVSRSSTESQSWFSVYGESSYQWAVIGDDQLFYTLYNVGGVSLHPRDLAFYADSQRLGIFGKFIAFNPANPGHTVLARAVYSSDAAWTGDATFSQQLGKAVSDPVVVGSRSPSGEFRLRGQGVEVWGAEPSSPEVSFPLSIQNGFVLSPTYVSSSSALWGQWPGLYRGTRYPSGQVVTGIPGMDGHAFLPVTTAYSGYARWFFDITGPWR